MAGRTKSSNVTIAETGLPGSPKIGKVRLGDAGRGAKGTGLPGRLAPSQKCCRGPSRGSCARALPGPSPPGPGSLPTAQRGQRGLDVIVVAHGDARGGDEEVGAQPP